MSLTPTQLARYRRRLEELRQRLAASINQIVPTVLSDAQPPGEHDRHVSESPDTELAIEQDEEHLYQMVREALERIAQGTYGICQRCGQPIAAARLEALPYTPYCVTCEAQVEQGR
jgi:DnaK suppressor protein